MNIVICRVLLNFPSFSTSELDGKVHFNLIIITITYYFSISLKKSAVVWMLKVFVKIANEENKEIQENETTNW